MVGNAVSTIIYWTACFFRPTSWIIVHHKLRELAFSVGVSAVRVRGLIGLQRQTANFSGNQRN